MGTETAQRTESPTLPSGALYSQRIDGSQVFAFTPTASQLDRVQAKSQIPRNELQSSYGHLTGSQLQNYLINGKRGRAGFQSRFAAKAINSDFAGSKSDSGRAETETLNEDLQNYFDFNRVPNDKRNSASTKQIASVPKRPKRYHRGIEGLVMSPRGKNWLSGPGEG